MSGEKKDIKKDDSKKIFEDAAADYINNNVPIVEEVELYETEEIDNSIETALKLTITNTTIHWSKLKEDIEGDHAERFNKELALLKGREFINMYLKALEFVKPKINRVEYITKNEETKSMKITIMKRDNKGNEIEIDITGD